MSTKTKFDERKSLCSLPIDRLGYAPVIAVMAALLCGIVAGGHVLLRCLPSYEKSYFIFNENEDNRLCIDPLLIPQGIGVDIECVKRSSIIPVSSSSTQNNSITKDEIVKSSEGQDKTHGKGINFEKDTSSQSRPGSPERKQINKKSVTQRFHDKLRSVTMYALNAGAKKGVGSETNV